MTEERLKVAGLLLIMILLVIIAWLVLSPVTPGVVLWLI